MGMTRVCFSALAATLLLAVGGNAQNDASAPLCLANCTTGTCVFKFKLDVNAGETGYYRVEGCEGTQPTLGMEEGVTYVFDQTDVSNWFHPLGFAYGPDGVYAENDELEKVVPDVERGTDLTCNETATCQHAQYMLNGAPLCDNDPCDLEDFGLDQYEGVWFSGGRDDWKDAGDFTVEVTVSDPGTTEIFYFCHIHNEMSGRIKILQPGTTTPKDASIVVEIPYEYNTVTGFDEECGTFNVSQYEDLSQCPDMTFHCTGTPDLFTRCMAAINCKMHTEMRTSGETDQTTQFMYQMIAHHQNAVSMAKILLKSFPPSLKCGTSYDGRRQLDDDGFCRDTGEDGNTPAITLLWDIINTQNQQITFMRAWLADNEQPTHDYCPADDSSDLILALGVSAGVLVLIGAALVGVYFWSKNGAAKPPSADVKPQ